MRRHLRWSIYAGLISAFMLLSLAAVAIAGQFEDAATAEASGDYATALKIFRQLADSGKLHSAV